MSREKVYNFSAGPSMMPESVLLKAKSELEDYSDCGMSIMEMSHRGKVFQKVFVETKEKLRSTLSIPDSHEILFLQGGATLQFAAIPMNLMCNGSADYAVTGEFSGKAWQEAKKYGRAECIFESCDRIPTQEELQFNAGTDYFYYCANNTIYGTEWNYTPEAEAELVCDMSSDILSKPIDVSKYGLLYAGAQKNMAPAGLTVVIIKKELAGKEQSATPKILSYAQMIKSDSMLNTPPCWCIYMLGLNLKWILREGGLEGMQQLRAERAGLVYDVLDASDFYIPHAQKDSRSFMNVTFRTPSEELDAAFVKGAAEKGLVNLKGHRVTGGIRASLYNAMPLEGARKLAEYMKEFEAAHV